jgi:putative transposase
LFYVENRLSESKLEISDEVWAKVAPILPRRKRKDMRGRPRMDDRQAMTAIWHKLRTGCSWKALPRDLGAGSTIHDRFQEWQAAGVFEQMRQAGILQYDEEVMPLSESAHDAG